MGMGLAELYVRPTVLAALRGLDLAAESVGDPLHAVADSQNRDAQFQYPGIAFGSFFVVDGAGAAAEDDADRLKAADFVEGSGTGEDSGEDLLFAYPASDELGVLAAEIEDYDATAFGLRFGLVLHGCSCGHVVLSRAECFKVTDLKIRHYARRMAE